MAAGWLPGAGGPARVSVESMGSPPGRVVVLGRCPPEPERPRDGRGGDHAPPFGQPVPSSGVRPSRPAPLPPGCGRPGCSRGIRTPVQGCARRGRVVGCSHPRENPRFGVRHEVARVE
jgi:hypothetical protein